MVGDLESRIDELLNSLRFSTMRNRPPQESDGSRLKAFHHRLKSLVAEEFDDYKRRRLKHILPAVICVREQLLFLRKCLHSSNIVSTSQYISKMHVALTAIMKESFQEDCRKAAIVLGALDVVAETLVLDIEYFGTKCNQENRVIRKLVASCLTNLTYGNLMCKRKLCAYPNFIENVIKVIAESHYLAQVYAGLLRNLSWMADSEMSAALLSTVSPLAHASVAAFKFGEMKCLCSSLAALWNLASHSKENKKALCDEPDFLESLIEIMGADSQQTALLESATGIFKYSTMYLVAAGVEQYLSVNLRYRLVFCLVNLLNSPSFTIIGNGLGIMMQLLAKDQQLRLHLRLNQKAMQYLNHLRNSAREDIRNPVKAILNYINSSELNEMVDRPHSAHQYCKPCSMQHLSQQCRHHVPQSYSAQDAGHPHPAQAFAQYSTIPGFFNVEGMSSSYGGSTTSSPFLEPTRLLKLRSAQTHLHNLALNRVDCNDIFSLMEPNKSVSQNFTPREVADNFASLPRESSHQIYRITSNCCESSLIDQPLVENSNSADLLKSTTGTKVNQSSSQTRNLIVDNELVDTELMKLNEPSYEIDESVRCTRCTSTQSLTSLLPADKSAWESVNNSAVNSNRLSPVSATDIPDSPTQCAASNDTEIVVKKEQHSGHDNVDPILKGSDTNQNVDQQLISNLDNVKLSTGNSSVNESGDYGIFSGKIDSELLIQSIEAAMPKKNPANDDFLALMIEKAQPKPNRMLSSLPNYSHAPTAKPIYDSSSSKAEDDDFLMQSIASVLPQNHRSGPELFLGNQSKKGRAMMGEVARPSKGPKQNAHATFTTSKCSSNKKIPQARVMPNAFLGTLPTKKETNSISISSSLILNAALQNSSLVESPETSEKIRDASTLRLHPNEESDTLSEDSYSKCEVDDEAVYSAIPIDVDQEIHAEQLLIDCNIIGVTSHKTKNATFQSLRKKSGRNKQKELKESVICDISAEVSEKSGLSADTGEHRIQQPNNLSIIKGKIVQPRSNKSTHMKNNSASSKISNIPRNASKFAKSLPNAHNYVQPNMVLNSTTLKAKKLNEKKIDSYSPSVKYLQKPRKVLSERLTTRVISQPQSALVKTDNISKATLEQNIFIAYPGQVSSSGQTKTNASTLKEGKANKFGESINIQNPSEAIKKKPNFKQMLVTIV